MKVGNKTLLFFIIAFSGLVPTILITYGAISLNPTGVRLVIYVFTTGYLIASSLAFLLFFGGIISSGNYDIEENKTILIALYFISIVLISIIHFWVFFYVGEIKQMLIFSFSMIVGVSFFIGYILLIRRIKKLSKKNQIDK